MSKMDKFNDFRQKLVDLKDKRVRLSFVIDGTERIYECYGWIRSVNEHTLEFENDPTTGNTHIKTSWFNLSSIIIYGIDEVDEEADLSEEKEGKYADVESVIEVKIKDDPDTVKDYTDEGWEVENYYSGKVQLIKRRAEE